MARGIDVIYDSIKAEKDSKSTLAGLTATEADLDTLLADINSGSKVSFSGLWIYIFSFSTNTLENLWDLFKVEVEVIKAQAIYGTEDWWIEKVNEFQLGDDLIIIQVSGVDVPGYAVIDPSKQITKASAIKSVGGVSTIKVAQEVAGELVAFDASQMIAIQAYQDRIQPAGVKVVIISLNSDLTKVFGDVFYNALLDESVVESGVETAIEDYLANIEFGGLINLNKLIDSVQLVEGVNDINITNIEAKPNGGVYVVFDREYETSAGYVKIDPSFLLSSTLTFTPQ